MPAICRLFATAAVLSLSGAAHATTVAYWNFDDGVPPAAATTLQTSVNSPALDGTGTGFTGGSAPVFSAVLPGPQITLGLGGPVLNATNDASLYFTNPGLPGNPASASASLVSVADQAGPGTLLKLHSFTIEGFVRFEDVAQFAGIFTKNRVDAGGSTWMVDTDGGGRLRARFDSQPLGLSSGQPGFNQGFTTTATVADGLWHHVALTYNGDTRAVALYLDYAGVATGTAVNALVYDDSPFRIGGSGGGRGFDGYMDEVRLSDTALAPAEFIRAVPEPGSVLLGAFGAVALLSRRRRG